MRLKSIDYTQFEGSPREWSLSGLTLGLVNLIVGKNASGKTRTLNIIHGLGKLVSGRQKPADLTTGTYRAEFEHQGATLGYHLVIKDHKVIAEEFHQDKRVLMRRGIGGTGSIYHEKEKTEFDFQTPETDAAVVLRRDTLQHPFLEPLAEWGANVRHFEFGGGMGHRHFAVFVKDGPPPDPRDVNAVIALFRQGVARFPGQFMDCVKEDLTAVGYPVETVDVMIPTDIIVQTPFGEPVNPRVLFVKERDLPGVTQQTDMSQGMFRALSVIIHLNYAVLASRPSCVIIDDIGEGLDFDRSCRLIDLLRAKALGAEVQLLLSTNDRYVMNKVPLEEWSLLQRAGPRVVVRNYENSKAVFDEFKFTGLSNFDFLATDFINEAVEEPVAHE